MAVLNVYNLQGDKTGTIDVNEAIFGATPNKPVLHEVLVAELSAFRQGTASTKTRAQVRGGGRKPFKQKGTGRARQGTIRAPQMVGGGVVFGPHPRNFEKKVNKKVRRLALISALSEKFANNEIIVLDGKIEAPKTKTFIAMMNKAFDIPKQIEDMKAANKTYSNGRVARAIKSSNKPLLVINDIFSEADDNLYMSARNVENIMVLEARQIGVYFLLKQDKIILTKEALATIEEVLA